MEHTQKQDEDIVVEIIEDALAMGTLMAVDWANGTARLDGFRRASVKLHFDKSLNEEMRRFATQYVQVWGKGWLKAPDTDSEEWVRFEVQRVCVPYQGKGKVFRKDEWEKDLKKYGSPFRSNEELQEFIDVIREGRHV